MQLKVNEIFYSLQGEGFYAGEAAIFIRLKLCNLQCSFCDTDWLHGVDMSLEEIAEKLPSAVCKRIIWTGGEPTLQLTDAVVAYFNNKGYRQSIETNGTRKVPHGLDYITCSPKVQPDVLRKNFNIFEVGEFRYLIGQDENGLRCCPPEINELPMAKHYYVSPMFVGETHKKFTLDKANLEMALEWVKADPRWRLSVQIHKVLGFR